MITYDRKNIKKLIISYPIILVISTLAYTWFRATYENKSILDFLVYGFNQSFITISIIYLPMIYPSIIVNKLTSRKNVFVYSLIFAAIIFVIFLIAIAILTIDMSIRHKIIYWDKIIWALCIFAGISILAFIISYLVFYKKFKKLSN
ncbi:hypothetical protein DRQ29_02000 [bacterium]|nr:MAG: hypothetical protein DRQ29_02000 [bacterium]